MQVEELLMMRKVHDACPYPTDEYRENRESVEAAVATLTQESKTKRGDTMATHVWWDCK